MLRGVLATTIAIVAGACSSFEAVEGAPVDAAAGDAAPTDAAACAAPTCAGEGPSCRAEDFTAGCGAFELSGDPSGVIRDCARGKLHVAAKNTLDAVGTLWVDTPLVPFATRISARVAVTAWDGGSMLRITLGAASGFEVRAVLGASGHPQFTLCDSTSGCSPIAIESAVGREHLFVFDLTADGLALSVDCTLVLQRAAIALPVKSSLAVAFGKNDADPIDGTLDDVVVSFR